MKDLVGHPRVLPAVAAALADISGGATTSPGGVHIHGDFNAYNEVDLDGFARRMNILTALT